MRIRKRRTLETKNGMSLAPFDRRKCIFVHIPKAAGVSVARSLFGNLAGGHTSIAMYQIAFSQCDFERYFKFTFVRNPWDRLFSAFRFLRQGGMTQKDQDWAREHIVRYRDFSEFVETGLSNSNVKQWVHFRPQSEFLCLPHQDSPAVDFLGMYENLERDFFLVRQRLSLDPDQRLWHCNKTTAFARRDFRDHYTESTREIVAHEYARDIDMFGYAFDNSSLPDQLAHRQKYAELKQSTSS